ncbi:hypothetical protein CROQUDRAFT_98576 [Cronartium quercuum f. sp. fusiforme G11]|uniref:Uncharacterized protein n=1 Tax=Cronartium quercuum f. sp. fusiforme G11 TaxID=708437 RepID=A0A9P6NDA9_9BASI|nr:hypothetical protein CROQUDRAFT_98576 [Cronartium quercuum f. sp. fusiforme G11]
MTLADLNSLIASFISGLGGTFIIFTLAVCGDSDFLPRTTAPSCDPPRDCASTRPTTQHLIILIKKKQKHRLRLIAITQRAACPERRGTYPHRPALLKPPPTPLTPKPREPPASRTYLEK